MYCNYQLKRLSMSSRISHVLAIAIRISSYLPGFLNYVTPLVAAWLIHRRDRFIVFYMCDFNKLVLHRPAETSDVLRQGSQDWPVLYHNATPDISDICCRYYQGFSGFSFMPSSPMQHLATVNTVLQITSPHWIIVCWHWMWLNYVNKWYFFSVSHLCFLVWVCSHAEPWPTLGCGRERRSPWGPWWSGSWGSIVVSGSDDRYKMNHSFLSGHVKKRILC